MELSQSAPPTATPPGPTEAFQVDALKVRVYRNRTELGQAVARDVADKMRELLAAKPRIRMVFAAAPSQNDFLAALVSLSAQLGIDWDRVTALHMDEYVGLSRSHSQTFANYLATHLFDKVHPGIVHLLDTEANPIAESARYAALFREEPIDIVCLGIGENGHVAFNDPHVADFCDPEIVKLVELDKECRLQQVHDGCFPSIDAVPKTALTLTVPALCSGAYLFCTVPGAAKRMAVQRTLHGPITKQHPASILRRHASCTLYLDGDSYEPANGNAMSGEANHHGAGK